MRITTARVAKWIKAPEWIVLELIASERLNASNVGTTTEPRWMVDAADLRDFLATSQRTTKQVMCTGRRRRSSTQTARRIQGGLR